MKNSPSVPREMFPPKEDVIEMEEIEGCKSKYIIIFLF